MLENLSKVTQFSGAFLALTVGLSFSSKANAALLNTIEGNACAGVFGTPPNCVVTQEFGVPEDTALIVKFDFDENGNITATTFGNFTSIDGSEFTFDFGDDGNTGTGSWTYTPGTGDPLVTAYVAKGGPNFNLFSNDGDPNTGDYFTPANPGGNIPGLSNFSFYDGDSNGGGVGPQPVPEPSALVGLVAIVGGLTISRRRQS